jgi:methionyl-tRNA synthetase
MHGFTQQGWECPKCGRVYSPSTHMCWSCPEKTITSTTTGQLLQAKEMEVEQMEAASKNSEAFADGYSQGYNRALELVKWALSNLIPPHNEQK